MVLLLSHVVRDVSPMLKQFYFSWILSTLEGGGGCEFWWSVLLKNITERGCLVWQPLADSRVKSQTWWRYRNLLSFAEWGFLWCSHGMDSLTSDRDQTRPRSESNAPFRVSTTRLNINNRRVLDDRILYWNFIPRGHCNNQDNQVFYDENVCGNSKYTTQDRSG